MPGSPCSPNQTEPSRAAMIALGSLVGAGREYLVIASKCTEEVWLFTTFASPNIEGHEVEPCVLEGTRK